MIIDKLKSKQYYLDKLSMFVRSSYGINEQVDLQWKVLMDIDSSIDDIFIALSLLETDETDDTLDKLADIVGIKRNLDVTYNDNADTIKKTLLLNNNELTRAIKTRILQNNYDGTYLELVKNYESIALEVLVYDDLTSQATIHQVLNDDPTLSENDRDMFLSGNYSIRSMGISYLFSIQDLDLLCTFDNSSRTWNNSNWGV